MNIQTPRFAEGLGGLGTVLFYLQNKNAEVKL